MCLKIQMFQYGYNYVIMRNENYKIRLIFCLKSWRLKMLIKMSLFAMNWLNCCLWLDSQINIKGNMTLEFQFQFQLYQLLCFCGVTALEWIFVFLWLVCHDFSWLVTTHVLTPLLIHIQLPTLFNKHAYFYFPFLKFHIFLSSL